MMAIAVNTLYFHGHVHPVNEQVTAGIAVYGNGGMNTNYKNNPYAVYDNTGSQDFINQKSSSFHLLYLGNMQKINL